VIKDMDTWTNIRRDVLVDQMSRREACRKYNLNFRTIQKILKDPEPPDRPNEYARDKPKTGQFISGMPEITASPRRTFQMLSPVISKKPLSPRESQRLLSLAKFTATFIGTTP